jgi:BirA family biotin operon repressor/biotin-[acetyl-CoA-carboxylase] ligase
MQMADLLAALASGQARSGVELAARAGVTRAAVWKQIEALRARGVPIEAGGAHGYRLPWPVELLDAARIRAALPQAVAAKLGALEVHWELDSTSSELQRRGAAAPDLGMLLAETQSAGRGRRGRHWLSPPGLNLYLSCVKRFDRGFATLALFWGILGVIVLRALETLGIRGAGLKWPNDVLADDGKLAGVLVEIGGERKGPCAVVIGVGINLRLTPALRAQAGQPVGDLATLAGGDPPERNRAAAALIQAMVEGLHRFERDGFAAFHDAYRQHDLLDGRPLRLVHAQQTFDAVGAGVDARGALPIRMADGSLRAIDSAEVTVRRA